MDLTNLIWYNIVETKQNKPYHFDKYTEGAKIYIDILRNKKPYCKLL